MRHDFATLSLPWRRNYQHSLHLMARQSIALATSSLAIAVGLRPGAGHPGCVQPQSNPEAVREDRTKAEACRWCAGASKPRANPSPEPTMRPVRLGRHFSKKFRPSEGPGGTRRGSPVGGSARPICVMPVAVHRSGAMPPMNVFLGTQAESSLSRQCEVAHTIPSL